MTVNVVIAEDVAVEDNWLSGVWATLRARWWLVLGVTLGALVAAVVYLRTADYLYTAELHVYAAPSSAGSSPGASSLNSLAAIAGLGGAPVESATPFRLYLDGVRAREVAERLARDRELMRGIFAGEWDPVSRGWREHHGVLGGIKRFTWNILGLRYQSWHVPDAARLADYIAENVNVIQNVKTPIVAITLDHPDPRFAVRFLTSLGAATDQFLREKQQERTRSNIEYLSEKLREVTLVEQRAALFAALSEQERQGMLANSQAPYAANPFGAATASTSPTKPRQIPLLIAGLVGGLILGSALALLLGRPRRVVSILDDGIA